MAAKAKALTVKMHIDGVHQTLAAFRRLPKEASDSLRDHTLDLSKDLARKVAAAARVDSRQSAAVAPTVKALRDRVPAIVAGGMTRVGTPRVPAYAVIFGSEFGAKHRFGWYSGSRYAASFGRQYRRHVGRGSYWFFRTVEENEAMIGQAWTRVADDIIDAWSRDGA